FEPRHTLTLTKIPRHTSIQKKKQKFMEACAVMDRGRTNVYRAVHGVLRERRNISPVTCCRRLRSAEVPSGRGPAGAYCRSKGLCRGWDRPERGTEEQSGSIVAMGTQPQVHPSGVRTWVEEHEPEDGPADAWPMDCREESGGEEHAGPSASLSDAKEYLTAISTGSCHKIQMLIKYWQLLTCIKHSYNI
uniref:SCAN box domain-containing protein n=1 Tax=Oryzias latipes TaxID=8090 RepID=A0A3P9M613_ORYLA